MEIGNEDAVLLRLKMDEQSGYTGELRDLLRKYDKDRQCATPDHVLARYLQDCLVAWENGVWLRKQWELATQEGGTA